MPATSNSNTLSAKAARPLMANMIRKQDKTLSYVANNTVREELYRGYVVRDLYLTLRYTIDPEGTATTGDIDIGDVQAGGEWGVIKRVKILASNNTIYDITGQQLVYINNLLSEGGLINSPLNTFLAGESAGLITVNSTLRIPFWMLRQAVPTDTMLNTVLLNDFSIEVQWGNVTDVVNPTATPSFGTAPTLTVSQYGSQQVMSSSGSIRRFTFNTRKLTGGSDQRIQLGLGEIYDWLIIHTKTENASTENPGHLRNLRIESGSKNYLDMDADTLRDVTHQDYGMIGPMGFQIAAGGAFSSVANYPPGVMDLNAWYPIRFGQDGQLSESLDARSLSQLDLIIDSDTGVNLDIEIIKGTISIPKLVS